MPYLALTIGQKLDAAQTQKLKEEFGRLITIIPGKSEADLIVHIHERDTVFMGGEQTSCAYIDLRVYTKTTDEAKKRFTREACEFLRREFAIPLERQYLTISEHQNWGYDGAWH